MFLVLFWYYAVLYYAAQCHPYAMCPRVELVGMLTAHAVGRELRIQKGRGPFLLLAALVVTNVLRKARKITSGSRVYILHVKLIPIQSKIRPRLVNIGKW